MEQKKENLEAILLKISSSINPSVKNLLSKKQKVDDKIIYDFSRNLKDLVFQHEEIKNIFENDENLLHFSGDVLFKTISRFLYLRNENVANIFAEEIENLKHQIFEPIRAIESAPKE
jgi:hypothetical protein